MLRQPEPLVKTESVTDWAVAQRRVNFVIMSPSATSGWLLLEASVRGESPAHHSTVRYFLEDSAHHRIRVKQYYNDWWIPTVADISFRASGRPIVVGDSVSFVGRDYRRHEGSCGHQFGTAVEFSLEQGEMTDAEWAALWLSLEAVVPSALVEARTSSFARRNYWNRWQRTMAPWDTSEISSLAWNEPTTEAMDRAAWALTADRWAPVPGAIDSLGFRTGPHGEEVQLVFRWPMTLNCSAWIRALRAPPAPWKPLIDASEVNRPKWESVSIGQQAVQRACMDPTVGNWYYAWRAGAKAYELHLRARPGLDVTQADAVVRGLLA